MSMIEDRFSEAWRSGQSTFTEMELGRRKRVLSVRVVPIRGRKTGAVVRLRVYLKNDGTVGGRSVNPPSAGTA